MSIKRFVLIALTINLLILGAVALSSPTRAQDPASLTGEIVLAHGDGQPGTGTYIQHFTLVQDDGTIVTLDIDQETLAAFGGTTGLSGERVTVSGTTTGDGFTVDDIASLGRSTPRNVTGNQPWLSIMCEFPGNDGESDTSGTVAYFQNMYSDEYPGLGHYWEDQSFGMININGSGVSSNGGGWHMMPNPASDYGINNAFPDLDQMAADCVDASGANLSGYVGVNLMFDESIGCCAWGGSSGAVNVGRVTWNPYWAWQNVTVIAHEMGHGFNLPHSNNYDGDTDPYDSPYDVMSFAYIGGSSPDPTYGTLGQGNIGYHRNQLLGWLDSVMTINDETDSGTYTLDSLSEPLTDPSHYQLLVIDPPSGNLTYTVEARTLEGYDSVLPERSILIYEVASRQEPAWLIGCEDDVDTLCEGALLGAGDSWTAPGGEITVNILSESSTGYEVQVIYGEAADAPPTAPTGLTAEATSFDAIGLSWNDTSDNEDNFSIERSMDGGTTWEIVGSAAENAEAFTDTDLTCATEYDYRVTALNTAGSSAASNTATATTGTCPVEFAVPNGSFEQPLDPDTNWTLRTTGGVINGPLSFSQAVDETSVLLFDGTGGVEGVEQYIPLTGSANDGVVMTFWTGARGTGGEGFIGAQVLLLAADDSLVGSCLVLAPRENAFPATQLVCTAIANGDFVRVQLRIGGVRVPDGFFGFDDVKVSTFSLN